MFGRLHSDTGNMLLCKSLCKYQSTRLCNLVHLRENGLVFTISIILSWLVFFSYCFNEVTWKMPKFQNSQLKCRLNIATFVTLMLAGLIKFCSLILFILFSSHIRPNFGYDFSFYVYLACMIGDLLLASFLVRTDRKLNYCLSRYYDDKAVIETNTHAINM